MGSDQSTEYEYIDRDTPFVLHKGPWMLIGGSFRCSRPCGIGKKRSQKGIKGESDFLCGVREDKQTMMNYLNSQEVRRKIGKVDCFNFEGDGGNATKASKAEALKWIKEKKPKAIYYSGHGYLDTGDWCFLDGVLTFKELHAAAPQLQAVVADCCYSGAWWADMEGSGVRLYAASTATEVSWDGDDGGKFTCYVAGCAHDSLSSLGGYDHGEWTPQHPQINGKNICARRTEL